MIGGAAAATSSTAAAKATRQRAEKAEQVAAREKRDQARYSLALFFFFFFFTSQNNDVACMFCRFETWSRREIQSLQRVLANFGPPRTIVSSDVPHDWAGIFHFFFFVQSTFYFKKQTKQTNCIEIMQRADIKFKTPQQLET